MKYFNFTIYYTQTVAHLQFASLYYAENEMWLSYTFVIMKQISAVALSTFAVFGENRQEHK